ncbi:unnamed protein product [Protopolystoma xenopodis]|uniref:Uncharacterized protein n=1 Tax=Protopolystoma xenopodis TaxID=117903 RepID=A0A3S5ASE3_9PLAT|nr:unnamed protein product [Protopolystoma xenopodis]
MAPTILLSSNTESPFPLTSTVPASKVKYGNAPKEAILQIPTKLNLTETKGVNYFSDEYNRCEIPSGQPSFGPEFALSQNHQHNCFGTSLLSVDSDSRHTESLSSQENKYGEEGFRPGPEISTHFFNSPDQTNLSFLLPPATKLSSQPISDHPSSCIASILPQEIVSLSHQPNELTKTQISASDTAILFTDISHKLDIPDGTNEQAREVELMDKADKVDSEKTVEMEVTTGWSTFSFFRGKVIVLKIVC